MSQVKISDFIASYIFSLGVKEVFLISGGGNLHIIDSIAKNKKLKYVCTHHEQAAAMAAECYARVSENIGVCLVTFGPAATNTITGVLGAWLDSIPVLYISGQVPRHFMRYREDLRQLGVQEVSIVELVKPITKYTIVINDPKEVKYHLQKAVYLAKSGRPGPVFLDIPSDIQSTTIDEKEFIDFDPEKENLTSAKSTDLEENINKVIILLKKSKNPIIFAGHGIQLAKARKEFDALVNQLKIPVLTTMSAPDLMVTENSLFIGRPGVFGDRGGNFAIQNADLVICIGSRNHLWNIGYDTHSFARNAKKVIVDIDKAELEKKTVIPDIPIQADAKDFLVELKKQTANATLPDFSGWLQRCQNWKKKYPVVLPEYKNEKKYVNSYYFTDVLSSVLKGGETIVTGVGTSFTGTLQSIKIKEGQRFHCNVGCASMGYDLPAAIGACFANNKKPVILITGDGSIMFNLQELQTILHYSLPIKIFLLNNSGYLAIKNSQNSFFLGKLEAVDKKSGLSFPNFKEVAKTFKIGYMKISNHTGISQKIKKALKTKGSIICDINMNPLQPLFPKVYSEKKPDGTMASKPLEDMYPFLSRDEFNANMVVSYSLTEPL